MFNRQEYYALLGRLMRDHASLSVSESMAQVIDLLERAAKPGRWSLYRDLAYDAAASRLCAWLPGALQKNRPEQPMNGLWVGIFHPNDGAVGRDFLKDVEALRAGRSLEAVPERIVADLYVGLTSQAGPSRFRADWVEHLETTVPDDRAHDSIATEVYDLGGLRDEPEEEIILGDYVLLALTRAAAANAERIRQLAGAETVQIACGFDEGYFFPVGQCDKSGFGVTYPW